MGTLSIREAFELGINLQAQGKFLEAEEIYKKILEIQPENSEAIHLIGLVKHQLGKNEDAIELITEAINISKDPRFYFNLATIYDSFGDFENAIKNFKLVLESDKEYDKKSLAAYNLGVFAKENHEVEKAINYYSKSLQLNPNFADAIWNRALLYLFLGDFEKGWKDYSYRFEKANPIKKRKFEKPFWNGEDLNGKRIFVLCEQGFGDNIQFVRLTKKLKDLGAYVIFECKGELKSLFENLDYIDEFVEYKKDFSDFDYVVYLMDIPNFISLKLEDVKGEKYLFADEKKVGKFSELFDKAYFNVGISWKGNSLHENDKNRSVRLEFFEKLKNEKIKFYSLQKDSEENLEKFGIIDLKDKINDFSDTSGIIENLDLVISVDTSIAHLSGALGKKCWVLLPFVPDWRWLDKRDDSPWYSSVKLFRQKEKGNWESVFEEVKKELEKVA